jgi:hypothetical protein
MTWKHSETENLISDWKVTKRIFSSNYTHSCKRVGGGSSTARLANHRNPGRGWEPGTLGARVSGTEFRVWGWGWGRQAAESPYARCRSAQAPHFVSLWLLASKEVVAAAVEDTQKNSNNGPSLFSTFHPNRRRQGFVGASRAL